jgi:general L-amino acid transport system permease protein
VSASPRKKLPRAVLRERLPGYVAQLLLLLVVAWVAWRGIANFVGNLQARSLASGFAFLQAEAGFEIAQSLIAFGPASSYFDAIVVATLNTLLVIALAGVLATVIGLIVAFGRLAAHPLIRGASTAYVEVFRNIPLLPGVADSLQFGDILLNNRGLFLPRLVFAPEFGFELPRVEGFNVSGGVTLLPELVALTLGLAIYNGTFLAEIFRAGILSVSRGQSEAAATVGLSGARAALLVILPQALRVALPPAAGQYQTLAKASSLAAAIGYPDIMQIVGGTVLGQTNQALEAMALVVLLYAAINLLIALAVNLANRRLLAHEGR